MSQFTRLIRFESAGKILFADLASASSKVPSPGTQITAYASFEDLVKKEKPQEAVVDKLLAPLPKTDLPIYCVGLNYRSHAKEASLNIPVNPPVWTKPFASLAAPEEEIAMSRYCASNFPDWEGELVFVTSKECRDITPEQANSYILGYTVGNDLSCRRFQMPEQNGGQFYYAKAFDKFAPIGPVLISPELYKTDGTHLTTRVNGQVMQNVEIKNDVVFSPSQILSFMSQSTTIPAYTAIMTGTPSGVGVFHKPRRFLQHNDVVEVEVDGIGVLRNKIVFPDGQESPM
ncbi:fumarylacetoacetate hydrolase family protein [Talaromyces stipitatus ATCC 10500]|uniref:Fumarylacetoacetate hydrolase family protein n=1 Tax=Talaromyces stipitatus (strain ATCC 10500 / CBS 375.48 / QM 6759 / NRRL 1006) TaxID=441959 RepID=B8MRV5_TALSN|nr:fumarylacetoacetate hydrolase family protein [Talaromyces stipitatus ATCC 10500]EED13288.1 fumarylacetoacetate hydrolase family protein [Talaromyces stipitatus ATCC 10500]